MSMSANDWRKRALNRGRVRNKRTGKQGNLVDWKRTAMVFTHYDRIGTLTIPVFEHWEQSETEVCL